MDKRGFFSPPEGPLTSRGGPKQFSPAAKTPKKFSPTAKMKTIRFIYTIYKSTKIIYKLYSVYVYFLKDIQYTSIYSQKKYTYSPGLDYY